MSTTKPNSKDLSPSRQLAIKTFKFAFQLLKDAGSSMSRKSMIAKMTEAIDFTEWEKEKYESSDSPCWERIFSFYTIPVVKAGFLQKSKGIWTLTSEGENAFKKDADEMINLAVALYKIWSKSKENLSSTISDNNSDDELINQKEINELDIEKYEEHAADGIRVFLKSQSPYDFQNFVAALLNAMEYHISYVCRVRMLKIV
ncbi:MAG: winged helix-turn-helix domain-containing protein [Bacteroidota bacterium]